MRITNCIGSQMRGAVYFIEQEQNINSTTGYRSLKYYNTQIKFVF